MHELCLQAASDDKHGAAKASKRLINARWPEQETSNSKDCQSRHKGHSETPFSQNVAGEGGRTYKVGAKVGSSEASGHGVADFEERLKVGVEDVQKAVCEAPEKEQRGNYNE